MNVYQKLAKARVTLQELGIKKSGKNGNRFNYFELKDFLPEINNINNDIGLLTQFTLVDEKAILCITNCEKPEEQICFESPVAHAKLQGGASPIQELGSQHTYMRRYMLLMAYEIVEDDTVDAQEQSDNSKQSKKQSTPKTEEVKYKAEDMILLAATTGITQDQILAKYKVASVDKLTQEMLANLHLAIEARLSK